MVVAARSRNMRRFHPLWISLSALLLGACSAGADSDRFDDDDYDGFGGAGGVEQQPGPPPDDCPDCPPGSGGEGPAVPEPDTAATVCYPGLNGIGNTCLPLVTWSATWGAAYQYPSHSSAQYSPPLRFVNLGAADADLAIADHFKLSEVMQEWKGTYGVFQPHVVQKLQWLRNTTGGSIMINSGYRSPGYNSSVDGATYSRHMFGDAADMRSSAVSLSQIRSLCQQLDAGYIGMYSTFVHCDWRNKPLEPAFFAPGTVELAEAMPWQETLPVHTTALELAADSNVWAAPATGFAEGEPYRLWTAYDEHGDVIETAEAEEYEPPANARRVHVWVGGQVEAEAIVP